MITWYVLLFILILVALTELYSFFTGVPTVASFPASRRKMIEVLKERSAGRDTYNIIDLGSGNGQLASNIARAMPNVRIVGIEISLVPWLISFLRRKIFGPRNVVFRRVDFWAYDCSTTDAVVVYLNGKVMDRASRKLRAELKLGATVITNEIPLQGDWQPENIIETGLLNMKIYVYRQHAA